MPEDESLITEDLARHLKVSPKLLEIVSDDPEQLAKLHRIQRALLSDRATRKALNDPNTSPQQLAALIEVLRKAEGGPQKDGAGNGAGFHFSISFPQSGKAISVDTRPPIEGTAQPA